jgi:hypothetical protein
MRFAALAFAAFVTAVGFFGVVAPARLLATSHVFATPVGLAATTAVRLIFGAVLFIIAPDSRAPDALHVIGGLVFVFGVITPFVGVRRSRRWLEWWSARGLNFMRAWAAVAIVFGSFLIYAVAS